jgi:hypothetical protein
VNLKLRVNEVESASLGSGLFCQISLEGDGGGGVV